jgi:hypothetical protein
LSDISGGYLTLNQTELQAGLQAKRELEGAVHLPVSLAIVSSYFHELSGHNAGAAAVPAIFPASRSGL